LEVVFKSLFPLSYMSEYQGMVFINLYLISMSFVKSKF
jgi:hypothetical protein